MPLVVLWVRSDEDIEDLGDEQIAFGKSGVLGQLWDNPAPIQRKLDAAGFVAGSETRVHVVGTAENAVTFERVAINVWNWPTVAGAPIVYDAPHLIRQVRSLMREQLVQTVPSGKRNSDWIYTVSLVEAEWAGVVVEEPPPPVVVAEEPPPPTVVADEPPPPIPPAPAPRPNKVVETVQKAVRAVKGFLGRLFGR